jgi:hypothetical protein
MKMHISQDDLTQISESQKRRLTELWKPEKYDLAIAYICKDADNEEYDKFEFVIGNIVVDNHARIYLNDIKAPEINPGETDSEDEANSSEAPETEDESYLEEDEEEQELSDEDFALALSYSRPSCFNKEECIPLVNIGQMIDILQRNNYGDGDFYMTVGTAEVGCELGKNTSNYNSYGFDHENKELCNALWELVKTIL